MKRRKLNRKDNLDLEMPKYNNRITLEMPKYKWENKSERGIFCRANKAPNNTSKQEKKIKQKEPERRNDGKMETRQ